MNNVLFLAGNIGLYPSLLKLIDSEDVLMQYKQIKYNFNQIIKEATQQKDLIWQQVAKSAIVYVSAKTNVEQLLPVLKEEMAFLEHTAILVRMPCLPMNCLIEIELLCDVTDPGSGDKTISCIQNTIPAGKVDDFLSTQSTNHYGEIFYVADKVLKKDLQSSVHGSEKASAIPCLEIIDISQPTGPQISIVERKYNL